MAKVAKIKKVKNTEKAAVTSPIKTILITQQKPESEK